MKSFRTERVAEQIRKEISDMLLRGIRGVPTGAGLISITEVEVTRDLSQAKVFVSIYGDPQTQETAMEALTLAEGYVRSQIGQRIRLRHTPEISFAQDISLERGDRLMALLNQIKKPSLPEQNLDPLEE